MQFQGHVSLSNFYEVFKLAKMIEIDVWFKWDFLKKLLFFAKKRHLARVAILPHIKTHIEFQNMQF